MSKFTERYGPWAIVTGATSGTGLLFAEQLAQDGFRLIVLARRVDALKKLAEKLEAKYRVEVRYIAIDLSGEDLLEVVADRTKDVEVGLVIHNAGFSITGEFIHTDLSTQMELLQLNCKAPVTLSHYFGRKMAERKKGGMIFISSSVAFTPIPLWSTYAASKAHILSFGEAFAYEMKRYGVDVLTVCPGGMKTGFQERAGIKTIGAMDPSIVVNRAMKSLGKKRVIIPGWYNRLAFQGFGRLIPGWIRLPLFGSMMARLTKQR